jgi:hypothetical protein
MKAYLTAEEYMRLSLDLEKEQATLNERRRELAERARISKDQSKGLELVFSRATKDHSRWKVTYQGKGHTQPEIKSLGPSMNGEPDIIIDGVPHAPSRAMLVPAPGTMKESATPGLREHQDTGNYPSVPQHLSRQTPAWEIMRHEHGRFTYHKLTKEQEDAIRYRSSNRSVS